ncbi:hypothetical protein BpHYR1_011479 [Brachionus plicatilis]|uniref:Uncharacterized protein n=1 Tax=Brachionus plicatilis TaxID=10195 RepID=A0A3M7QF36_BRAPC|nr:hypothetical protein BpHYR1_011479 [Brachionus plicatilis]
MKGLSVIYVLSNGKNFKKRERERKRKKVYNWIVLLTKDFDELSLISIRKKKETTYGKKNS